MGTSGNRVGYKVFSFGTTVRNPKRNEEFLEALIPFDKKVIDDKNLGEYYAYLLKKGIYQANNISEEIKQKWEDDIDLTEEEIEQIIEDNPQACGNSGRVMTQLRTIKDQGFLIFEDVSSNHPKITISELGWELLEGTKDAADIYTRAMIGIQANSPARVAILNESRPFLNTLFVIRELKKKWADLGEPAKGIHPHELSTFVMSMVDCNYMQAVEDIIEYRKKYRHTVNIQALQDYITSKGMLPISKETLITYADDVFRKFEMTGLIIKRGVFSGMYYDFSSYNQGKIDEILEYYKDYSYVRYSTAPEYYHALASIELPWERNNVLRKRIIEIKASVLNMQLNPNNTYEENEAILDRIFYTNALKRAIDKVDINDVYRELHILSGKLKEKPKYDDIPDSLRLEYVLALALGKKYGTDGLISNIMYNEEGRPLHCAAAGKCDIIYINPDGSYILEPTMLTGRDQQANNETTNVARHAREEERKLNVSFRVMMIAPRVHPDVEDWFQFRSIREKTKMMALSIERVTGLFVDSNSIPVLNTNYDELLNKLIEGDPITFADEMNSYVAAV